MSKETSEKLHKAIRDSLIGDRDTGIKETPAGTVIAAINCCNSCAQWWVNSDLDSPETHFIWRYVEPHATKYLWQDYKGWYRGSEAPHCPTCNKTVSASECVLCFDDAGEIVWPELEQPLEEDAAYEDGNPFISYVSQSKKMDENMTVIAAWEERRESLTHGYTADINDLRDEMAELRTAFKDAVYSYAPLLPPGWRVTGDFDKWVKGESCAGFLHGEIIPDVSLMIGGRCSTVSELQMELDRLFRYVTKL